MRSAQGFSKGENISMNLKGRDGISVSIPGGCLGLQGIDGHMVAIPPGKIGVQDEKGRMRIIG